MELAMAYHECRPVITGENDGENLSDKLIIVKLTCSSGVCFKCGCTKGGLGRQTRGCRKIEQSAGQELACTLFYIVY